MSFDDFSRNERRNKILRSLWQRAYRLSVLRRLGLGIAYFIAIVYAISILLPSVYCLRHGCTGPCEAMLLCPPLC